MNNILISIDESTTSTGYAVFDGEKLIDYGALSLKSKNVLERVDYIIDGLKSLIQKYEPSNIALENVQITMSAVTAKSLMGLQFMIELLAYQHNIPCTIIRPSSWRKKLGLSNSPKLKRVDKKKETEEYVKNIYGVEASKDDISDAIAIGAAFLKEEN